MFSTTLLVGYGNKYNFLAHPRFLRVFGFLYTKFDVEYFWWGHGRHCSPHRREDRKLLIGLLDTISTQQTRVWIRLTDVTGNAHGHGRYRWPRHRMLV